MQRFTKSVLLNYTAVIYLAYNHCVQSFSKSDNFSEYQKINGISAKQILEADSIKNASRSFLVLDHCPFVYSLIALLLGALIICSIIGNSFVIAAIYLEKSLQNVANYLIVSLACADLMVAIIVMPFAAYQELSNTWSLGSILCDIWTSFDVFCCTASILHLVAIALDRYWAITNCNYGAKRTGRRIIYMILIIWLISTVMGVSPHLFGLGSLDDSKSCHLTDNLTYQLVSTFFAFYLPLVFMCIIYWKIFQSAKFRIRKKAFNNNRTADKSNANTKKIVFLKKESKKIIDEVNNSTEISAIKCQNTNESNESKSNEIIKSDIENKLTCNQIESSCENEPTASQSSDTESPASEIASEQPKFKKMMARNKLIFHYLFTMRKNQKRHSNALNNEYSSKLSGEISEDECQLSKINCDENSSIETNNNNAEDQLNNEKEEQKDNNLYKSKSFNSSHNKINDLKNNLMSTADPDLVRSYSLKSFLIKSNLKCKSKVIKIRKPFVFSESNLPTEDNEKKISLIVKSSPLPNKADESPTKDNENKVADNQKPTNETTTKSIETYRPLNKCDVKQLSMNKSPSNTLSLLDKRKENTLSIHHSEVDILMIRKKQAKIDMKRERKAAKTLGVIMSCFIICWLPFFFMQLFFSVCKDCYLTHVLRESPIVTILLWLGYINSLLNPIIYTIFSPDFRIAFSKILFGKYRTKKRYF